MSTKIFKPTIKTNFLLGYKLNAIASRKDKIYETVQNEV